jgi:nitrite reductase/ring-hydroxylating ferredoxin subunit/DMSO/TMAO reductase YedYZ heme-binding membrane subunit
MSSHYQAVNWNRQKFLYDGAAVAGVVLVFGGFIVTNLVTHPAITIETLLIRGLAVVALLLLHLILCIGPLSRLDRRFLPLLYNRRHLGVLMFLLALAHAVFSIIQFHSGGDLNPVVSMLAGNRELNRLPEFPFEILGALALVILFLMAATSHDYWLANLTPPVWKTLHLLVYVAYGLLVAHVALGVLQAERSALFVALLGFGMVLVFGLHLVAGWRERPAEAEAPRAPNGWLDVGSAAGIPEGRARVATAGGERVAVFRHEGKLSCVSNVCRHQNGPLGEGRIVNGCITCPWHGYQYLPDSGTSPPPFTEKIPTFNLAVVDGRVLVDPIPNPPGTRVEPVPVP